MSRARIGKSSQPGSSYNSYNPPSSSVRKKEQRKNQQFSSTQHIYYEFFLLFLHTAGANHDRKASALLKKLY